MRRVADVDSLEAIVGKVPQIVMMKETRTLDDGCRTVLASSPIAGFGFRGEDGVPRTTLVGGVRGFARIDSPTRLSFASDAAPAIGSGVSFVFFVPGVGETLRLNGAVLERSGQRIVVDLHEAYVHCARCILRSGLWNDPPADAPAPSATAKLTSREPLAERAVADFLAASHFALASSWNASGASDTSPKGDPSGFIRVLDGGTLAIPDRRGNKRADTLHNLLSCDEIAIAALAPGRDELLHMSGRAYATDDGALLDTMALRGKPPHLALVVRVERAEIAANEALRRARPWNRFDRGGTPDMNRVATAHIAANEARGVTAAAARTLSRALGAAPSKVVGRVMDLAYRKQLEDEGY